MNYCVVIVLAMLTTMAQLGGVEGGSRILMIPVTVKSHFHFFSRLGLELARLGDEVTIVVPSNNKMSFSHTQERFEVLSYPTRFEDMYGESKEMRQRLYDVVILKSLYRYISWFEENIKKQFEQEKLDLLENRPFMDRLKARKFDFLILDFGPLQYTQVIAKFLDIPYAFFNIPLAPWHVGVPRLPSTSSNLYLGFSNQLSFTQRVKNLLLELLILHINSKPPAEEWKQQMLEKYDIEVKNDDEILKNASLQLYLEDPVVGYPQASMPYSLSVGDIMAAQPASPLPQDLALFVQQRPTILVSFGSFFGYLPQQQTDKFCRVFTAAKELNFVWKFENVSVCGEHLDNLLIRPWLPQNDLLASSSGFISHGGFNSVMEAVSNSVPLVLFPIAVDQHYMSNMAEDKGFGIQMDLANWEAEELLHNVRAIVAGGYKQVATRYSTILKHRPLSAAQRVSHAVGHVVKFGSDHLKSASMQLNWFQLFMFDVFLFLLVLVCVLLFAAVFVAGCLITKLCSVVTGKRRSAKPKSA